MNVNRHAATRPQAFGLAEDDVVEIDGQQLGRFSRGVEPGEHEQIVDQALHLGDFCESLRFAGLPIRFVLGGQVHLGNGAERRERALQLVRRVGNKTTLPVGGIVESPEHFVHRPREAADLVMGTGFRHAAVQIRLADGSHLGANRLHRSQRPARDPPRHERDESDEQRNADSQQRREMLRRVTRRLEAVARVHRHATGRGVDGLRCNPEPAVEASDRTRADTIAAVFGPRR